LEAGLYGESVQEIGEVGYFVATATGLISPLCRVDVMKFWNRTERMRARELAARVYELRLKGKRPGRIAEELGVSLSTVYRAFNRAYSRRQREIGEYEKSCRLMDLNRVDELLQRAWSRMENAEEKGLVDLKSMEFILKLLERRARILGYEAPVRQTCEHQYGSLAGPELLEEAERRGIPVSVELRARLLEGGRTVMYNYPGGGESKGLLTADAGGGDSSASSASSASGEVHRSDAGENL
jgi:transposase